MNPCIRETGQMPVPDPTENPAHSKVLEDNLATA